MSRSKWKNNFCSVKFKSLDSYWLKSRNSVIPIFLIGKKVYIYNGLIYKRKYIQRAHVGYKLGELLFTRQFYKNKILKKNSKKIKKN